MKSNVVSGEGESFRGARVVSGAVAFFDGWFRGIDFAVCVARASAPAGNALQGGGGGGIFAGGTGA